MTYTKLAALQSAKWFFTTYIQQNNKHQRKPFKKLFWPPKMLWNETFSLIFKNVKTWRKFSEIERQKTVESDIPKVFFCKTWQINAKFNSDTSTRFLLSFWLFCVCVNVACSIGSIMLLASSHSVEKSPKMSHFQKWLKIVLLHFWRQNSNFKSQNETFL